jgi:predicted pyridoxine 5'-phosphate oxidase superfamily flavin-nucleotide-binding protein
VIRVTVESVYLHCAKAFMRSQLWDTSRHTARSQLPSMAEMMRDGASLEDATAAYGIMLVDDGGAYGVGGGGSPMDLVHRGNQASAIPRAGQTRASSMPPNGYAVGIQKNFQVNSFVVGERNPRRYGTSASYWHAVVRTPTGLWDPTEKMRVRR